MRKKIKKIAQFNLWNLYTIFLAMVVTFIAVYFVDWPSLILIFSTAHLQAFLLSQPLQILSILLIAIRFGIICNADLCDYKAIICGYALSIALNSVLPGRMSEIVKFSYANRYTKIKPPTLAAGIISEKTIDMLILSSLLAVSFNLAPGSSEQKYTFLAITFSIVAILACLTWATKNKNVSNYLSASDSGLAHFLSKFFHAVIDIMKLSSVLKIFSITLGGWMFSFASTHVALMVLLHADFAIKSSFLVFVAMVIGRAIPGLPGSIGTFEASIVFAMSTLGYGITEALAVAFTLRASQVVLVAIFGIFILLKNGSGLSSFLPKLVKKKP